MATQTTFFATRRRNVKPTSSILRTVTRDIDCSGASFVHPPEDGQFISCRGQVGFNQEHLVFHGADALAVTATSADATGLKMVWASALQSDRQALGDKRVPVLWQGGIEVECKLFECDSDEIMTHANNFPIGRMVTVMVNTTAVALKPGSATPDLNERLVLTPFVDETCGWVVGYVTAVSRPAGDPVQGDSVTVMLYDQPRYIPLST
jgi:hypothetical protein